jgi:CheY-like chemotaxis protein
MVKILVCEDDRALNSLVTSYLSDCGYEVTSCPNGEEGLFALNRKVELPAYIFAYGFGIIASLILGLGMCLAMQVIGTGIPLMVLGIVIGIIGIALVSVNYPIFLAIMKARKKKYAEKVISLSDELLNK